MVWLDTKCWVCAVWGLHEPFAIRTLQGDAFEQDHHDQIQTPDFVCLSQAVDPPDLTLLVWIG